MRGVTLLGATGSVGRSTLDVLRTQADAFRLIAVSAGQRADDLADVVTEFRPRLAALADGSRSTARLERACAGAGTELALGVEASVRAAAHEAGDIVVAAIVGAAGLRPTAAAITRGATVALANKEALVVAGAALTRMAAASGSTLLPVDSEHAAIHQCLRAGRRDEVRRLVLTASGGPFRQWPAASLTDVTVEDALRHPTWKMGPKITVDSATLMNKGLEIIEAHWLFGFPQERIDVILHPQSIVHSMVEFRDGSVIAQLNAPDMGDPIRYCLTWPDRLDAGRAPFDLAAVGALTFEPPDERRFPCLRLAREAIAAGGAAPAILNAANEVAVAAFLDRRLPFLGIPRVIEQTLACVPAHRADTLEETIDADRAGREAATNAVSNAMGTVP